MFAFSKLFEGECLDIVAHKSFIENQSTYYKSLSGFKIRCEQNGEDLIFEYVGMEIIKNA